MSLLNRIDSIGTVYKHPDAPPTEDKSISKEEIIELLGEDETNDETLELDDKEKKGEEDKKTEEKGKEDTGEEDEKLEDEIEKELEEEKPSEEKLEFTEPARRKEILAKYPNLFKDFPQLEKAYYREQAYAEILPTIEDAKAAVERSELLDKHEESLLSGSTVETLRAVKENDQEAFYKLVDNYLPSLMQVDQDAYHHVLGTIIKHTIITMVKDGKANENDELISAADIVNQYIFGEKKFTPPSALSRSTVDKAGDEREKQLEERERGIIERQFESTSGELNTRISNILKSTIDKNIDPKESMTPYVRGHAIRECQDNLEELIDGDSRFRAILDKLWERAFYDDFSRASLDRIKSAYLSKAKTFLPEVIRKSRNDALKGLGKKVQNDDEKDKKGPLPVGSARRATSISGKTDSEKAKEIPKGTRTLDYLMQD